MATLPNGEHASAVIALACHALFDAIDRNGRAGAAHGLTWKGENALDKWYISRQVTAASSRVASGSGGYATTSVVIIRSPAGCT